MPPLASPRANDPEPAYDSLSDSDKTRAFIERELVRLGFTVAQASVLAPVVDWHQAADLIAEGCPADIAFDILS
jgi:hypothetical protein